MKYAIIITKSWSQTSETLEGLQLSSLPLHLLCKNEQSEEEDPQIYDDKNSAESALEQFVPTLLWVEAGRDGPANEIHERRAALYVLENEWRKGDDIGEGSENVSLAQQKWESLLS